MLKISFVFHHSKMYIMICGGAMKRWHLLMVMGDFWDVLSNVFVVFLSFSSSVDVARKLNGVFFIP
jgi:hypothetical protein